MPTGQKRVRNRSGVKSTHKALADWLAFINQEKDAWGDLTNHIPGVAPVAIAAYGADRLRQWARAFLMKVAKAPAGERIEGPPRIYQKQANLLIAGETVLSKILDALDAPCDLSRLRTCSQCDNLFVALKSDMKICSATCRQKKFYDDNREKERKRGREKMQKRRRKAKASGHGCC